MNLVIVVWELKKTPPALRRSRVGGVVYYDFFILSFKLSLQFMNLSQW